MNDLIKIFNFVKKWYILNKPELILYYKDRIKKQDYVEIRQVAQYLAKKYTNYSLTDIATHIGGHKSHATVLNSIKKIQDREITDPYFAITLTEIDKLLYADMFAKKVYISGSITKNLNKYGWRYTENLFLKAERKFKKYDVINPMKLFTEEEVATFRQIDFMSRCISLLVKCETIYMLKNYEESYNACIELEIAKSLNLKIIYEETLG